MLLELFLRHRQEVLSIEDIIESLWTSMEYPAEATVRSHIRHLREKLKSAGLPEDIITTMRGQGYCLKPLPQAETSENILTSEQADKNSKHLAALTLIWNKHRPKRQQQLTTIEQAVAALQQGTLELSDRLSAIVAAHSLAGNLGQFGLYRGSELARELEELLQNNPHREQWQVLSLKLTALNEEIANERDISPQINQKLATDSPLLLIVGDVNSSSQITQEAKIQGIRTKILPTSETVKIWLERQQERYENLPQVVLLTISFTNLETDSQQEYLELIAEFKLLEPSIPVIVIADRDRFGDRLRVSRHGGSFYLTQPLTASQIIAVCQQAIQRSSRCKKIMIVDDDSELLQVLPSLLQPWGFQLTTLQDPRQFWEVLQAVNPDLVLLDIEMPHLSGIELCKVLRTHPYWCKLPVLFLSIHNDRHISSDAFASGASDYICKPATARQLAHRIINHLARST